MKYTQIICWLTEEDEARLKKENTQNVSIYYTHSKDEFSSLINKNTYNVISFTFAEKENTDVLSIVRKYSNLVFHLFAIYEGDFTMSEYEVSLEKNIANHAYLAEDIIKDYCNSL